MSRWYQRRLEDVRSSSFATSAPRRRRRILSGRWHPRLIEPAMPVYLPDQGEEVVVRLRRGTLDNYDEVHGRVVGRSAYPDRTLAYLQVQNCTRRVFLSWHGSEWKCDHDVFYFEVDLKPEASTAS